MSDKYDDRDGNRTAPKEKPVKINKADTKSSNKHKDTSSRATSNLNSTVNIQESLGVPPNESLEEANISTGRRSRSATNKALNCTPTCKRRAESEGDPGETSAGITARRRRAGGRVTSQRKSAPYAISVDKNDSKHDFDSVSPPLVINPVATDGLHCFLRNNQKSAKLADGTLAFSQQAAGKCPSSQTNFYQKSMLGDSVPDGAIRGLPWGKQGLVLSPSSSGKISSKESTSTSSLINTAVGQNSSLDRAKRTLHSLSSGIQPSGQDQHRINEMNERGISYSRIVEAGMQTPALHQSQTSTTRGDSGLFDSGLLEPNVNIQLFTDEGHIYPRNRPMTNVGQRATTATAVQTSPLYYPAGNEESRLGRQSRIEISGQAQHIRNEMNNQGGNSNRRAVEAGMQTPALHQSQTSTTRGDSGLFDSGLLEPNVNNQLFIDEGHINPRNRPMTNVGQRATTAMAVQTSLLNYPASNEESRLGRQSRSEISGQAQHIRNEMNNQRGNSNRRVVEAGIQTPALHQSQTSTTRGNSWLFDASLLEPNVNNQLFSDEGRINPLNRPIQSSTNNVGQHATSAMGIQMAPLYNHEGYAATGPLLQPRMQPITSRPICAHILSEQSAAVNTHEIGAHSTSVAGVQPGIVIQNEQYAMPGYIVGHEMGAIPLALPHYSMPQYGFLPIQGSPGPLHNALPSLGSTAQLIEQVIRQGYYELRRRGRQDRGRGRPFDSSRYQNHSRDPRGRGRSNGPGRGHYPSSGGRVIPGHPIYVLQAPPATGPPQGALPQAPQTVNPYFTPYYINHL